ncbi:MAG: macro domain-containing protein [Hydrogenophaga sp.]|uniref:type II toxin-antitoxin system antitoxin DNA ADP-ribosyl glycohydrolase DarG n=1 Tax=Hydrogenophaga sp. TaxID=1904254 RepID=UPI00263327C3|nr:macro domain-containing protein [Hydrogenophaga sp.]MCV0438432.1 macro domain-containing protein [Hydrogenophaga sp.]
MIHFTTGNLLESKAEALVNTVNTVGVMGKGIALMFKERFDDNFQQYAQACKGGEVHIGQMFVTEPRELDGPRWVINFPTKQNWRHPSRLEWVTAGLQDLRRFLLNEGVRSVAIPPLGAGNGGLDWSLVREQIEAALGDLDIEITVFEPTSTYQNVAKRSGVEKLTPARALVAELVRRYWVLGMECSLLEIQKLAWFLQRSIERQVPGDNPLKLQFEANKFGPYAHNLTKLLDGLDGSYLRSEKRIADADPFDVIWFADERKDHVQAYLRSEGKAYTAALEDTARLIDGFESPFGMELLATVDWLLTKEGVAPTVESVREGVVQWPHEGGAARKAKLFDDRSIGIALERLTQPAASHVD